LATGTGTRESAAAAEARRVARLRGNRIRHADGRSSHGLGLFIAQRALKAQGGDLQLLHSGAQGNAWRLVLPQGGLG
jgi:K+-sensing histidine kinase KdpD